MSTINAICITGPSCVLNCTIDEAKTCPIWAGPTLVQAHETDLPEDSATSESPSETAKVEKYRVTLKPTLSKPATEESETAQEDLRLFLDFLKILRAFECRD